MDKPPEVRSERYYARRTEAETLVDLDRFLGRTGHLI